MSSSTIINFPRKRASSIELPDATAWLEYLELGMQTVYNGSTVQYEVQATYRPAYSHDAEINWRISHPFDAYRRFRKQLLRRLQPGHLCPAECKWLHSVVKNHFPKPRLFAASSLRTTEARQQSLIRILRTLQASLVNRGNQGCNVLVRSVCYDFTTFILGSNPKLPDIMVAMAMSRCSSDQSTRNSSASFRSNCSDCDDCGDVSPCDNYGRKSGRGYCKSESGQ